MELLNIALDVHVQEFGQNNASRIMEIPYKPALHLLHTS
jgi:hypothetical protein